MLRRDALTVTVSPEAGGALLAFRRGDFDLFHPTAPGEARNHTLFPLVPISGRIDHARFTFAGETHQVPPNFPPEPHAIHGVGWQLPWRVAAHDAAAASVTLVLDG